MAGELNQQDKKTSLSFYTRFDLEIGIEQVRDSFYNRTINLIETLFPQLEGHYLGRRVVNSEKLRMIATKLGIRYSQTDHFHDYSNGDFIKLLHSLEAAYETLEYFDKVEGTIFENGVIKEALSMSEIDLEIQWESGLFVRSGAKLLDDNLLNDNLDWLSDPKYSTVLDPFKKGLGHWMEVPNKPERLKDVVTEMYEALEAMAKLTVGNDKDLSANREAFGSKLKLGEYFKKMLRDYIDYANEYRHALKLGEKRPLLISNEVEAFFYLTGIYIRLVIQQLSQ